MWGFSSRKLLISSALENAMRGKYLFDLMDFTAQDQLYIDCIYINSECMHGKQILNGCVVI